MLTKGRACSGIRNWVFESYFKLVDIRQTQTFSSIHRSTSRSSTVFLSTTAPLSPITDLLLQAKEAGEKMKAFGIEYVITSPFLRCLQTSSEIVAALGMAQGQWLLDWSMAEVSNPTTWLKLRWMCLTLYPGQYQGS